MTIEHIAIAALGAVVMWVWKDMSRRVGELEKANPPLTKAVTELTVEMRHLRETITRVERLASHSDAAPPVE